MRRDPTSERSYSKAVQLIKTIFDVNIRKVQLFNITKSELRQILKIREKFLQFYRVFYLPDTDTIYIIEGNEEDLQTFIHETLHSNSIFHYHNSPVWVYEGLTKALTEFIIKKQQLELPIDYYLMREKEFWLDKMQIHQNTIIQAYFATNLEVALNLLKISFNDL